MQEQQMTATGPVTLDDVRNALGETSAFDTNASKIRSIIGRGSFATIQKHLDTLRAERIAAAQPAAEQSAPKAPQDAVELLWAAAWGAAQTKTLARLESLSGERDGLYATTAAQAADLLALTEQLDTLDTQSRVHVEALAAAQAAAAEQAASAGSQAAAQAAALTAVQSEIARLVEASAHAAERAALTAQVERQTLQSTIDRMHEQLAELKALHIVAATATAHPTAKTKKE